MTEYMQNISLRNKVASLKKMVNDMGTFQMKSFTILTNKINGSLQTLDAQLQNNEPVLTDELKQTKAQLLELNNEVFASSIVTSYLQGTL